MAAEPAEATEDPATTRAALLAAVKSLRRAFAQTAAEVDRSGQNPVANLQRIHGAALTRPSPVLVHKPLYLGLYGTHASRHN